MRGREARHDPPIAPIKRAAQAGPGPGQELGGKELPDGHPPRQQSPGWRKVPPLLLRGPARPLRLWVAKDGADAA